MVSGGLVCSESYCNIHDVGLSVWDEDGKRPRNRNPWDGFCLRIKALKSISKSELPPVSYQSDLEDIEGIRGLIRQEVAKAVRKEGRPPEPARREIPKQTRRKGGTPI
jgi:hypothetical protein